MSCLLNYLVLICLVDDIIWSGVWNIGCLLCISNGSGLVSSYVGCGGVVGEIVVGLFVCVLSGS